MLTVLLAAGAVAVLLRSPVQARRLASLRPQPRLPARPGRRAAGAAGALTARLARGRRLALQRARAVEACGALAAELRAGRSPEAALQVAAQVAVAATARALQAAATAAAVGGDPALRLAEEADATASPQLLRGLAACWSVCTPGGAGLAAAVDRVVTAERDLQQRRLDVAAELAGPRATARLLAALPVLGLLLATALGAAPLAFLLGTGVGRVDLLAGVGLDVAGLLWTRRLVRRAGAA